MQEAVIVMWRDPNIAFLKQKHNHECVSSFRREEIIVRFVSLLMVVAIPMVSMMDGRDLTLPCPCNQTAACHLADNYSDDDGQDLMLLEAAIGH